MLHTGQHGGGCSEWWKSTERVDSRVHPIPQSNGNPLIRQPHPKLKQIIVRYCVAINWFGGEYLQKWACLLRSSHCKLVKVYGWQFKAKSQNSSWILNSYCLVNQEHSPPTSQKTFLVNLFRKKTMYKLRLDLTPAHIFLFWIGYTFLWRSCKWFHGSAHPRLDYSCFPQWEVSKYGQNATCVSLCMCPRFCKSRPVNPFPFQSASCFYWSWRWNILMSSPIWCKHTNIKH